MTHYRLTDEDAHSIAFYFAKAKCPVQGHQNEQEWFSEFIAKYNKMMDEIKKYNQSSGD